MVMEPSVSVFRAGFSIHGEQAGFLDLPSRTADPGYCCKAAKFKLCLLASPLPEASLGASDAFGQVLLLTLSPP